MKRFSHFLVFLSCFFLFSVACDPGDADDRSKAKNLNPEEESKNSSNSNLIKETIAKFDADSFKAEIKTLSTGGEGILVTLPSIKAAAMFRVKLYDASGTLLKTVNSCDKNLQIPCLKAGKMSLSVASINKAGTYENETKKEVTCSADKAPGSGSSAAVDKLAEDWGKWVDVLNSALDTASEIKTKSETFVKSAEESAKKISAESTSEDEKKDEKTITAAATSLANTDACSIIKNSLSLGEALDEAQQKLEEDIDSVTAIAVTAVALAGTLAAGGFAMYKKILEDRAKKLDGEINEIETKMSDLVDGGKASEAKKLLGVKKLQVASGSFKRALLQNKLNKLKQGDLKFPDNFETVIKTGGIEADVKKLSLFKVKSGNTTKFSDLVKSRQAFLTIKTDTEFESFKKSDFAKSFGTDLPSSFADAQKLQTEYKADLESYKGLVRKASTNKFSTPEAKKALAGLNVQTQADIDARAKARKSLLLSNIRSVGVRSLQSKAQAEYDRVKVVTDKVKTQLQEIAKNDDLLTKLKELEGLDDIQEYKSKLLEILPDGDLKTSVSKITVDAKISSFRTDFSTLLSARATRSTIDLDKINKLSDSITSGFKQLGNAVTQVSGAAKQASQLRSLGKSLAEDESSEADEYKAHVLEAFEELNTKMASADEAKVTLYESMDDALVD